MRIDGEWLRGRYDEVRPVFRGRVAAANGTIVDALFLVDTGADKPVLSADVFAALGLPRLLISRLSVVGVGGAVTTVPVDAKLHLFRDTGGPVALNGPF